MAKLHHSPLPNVNFRWDNDEFASLLAESANEAGAASPHLHARELLKAALVAEDTESHDLRMLRQQIARAALVLLVHVRVQEADGNRFNAFAPHPCRCTTHIVVIKRDDHLPLGVESLPDSEAQMAGHERRGFLKLQIVQLRTDLAGDFEHVSEAIRCDEGRARGLPFNDGVCGNSRTVHDAGDVGGRDAGIRDDSVDDLDEGG